MLMVFCSPLRYVQGPDAMHRLGEEMTAVGLRGPALVVASGTPIARLAPTWSVALGGAGITYRVYSFGGESSRAEIAAIIAEAERLSARVVVAVGGGKVIDAGRAAAAGLGLPFVCCPTVCSTDAPTSAVSVIYADSGPNCGGVEAYELHRRSPDLVLVDTQVVAEGPPRLLAAGIGDAMSTWYEARAATAAGRPNMRGGRAGIAAVELARLCRDTVFADGEAALAECRAGRVGPSLERVAEATTLLSGIGFESAGLAAAHAVHNGLAAIAATRGMLHGEKVAFGTLVQLFMELAVTGDPEARAAVLREARRVGDFFMRVGLPVTLADVGIAADDARSDCIARIAARATQPEETIHNMPFPVTAALVETAIGAADAEGRVIRGDRPSDRA